MSSTEPDVLQVVWEFNFLPSFSLDAKETRLRKRHFQVTERRLVQRTVGTQSQSCYELKARQ